MLHPPSIKASKIDGIKNFISKKLPKEFPMKVLDEHYEWLEHPECQYNPGVAVPRNLELKSYRNPKKKGKSKK